MGGLLLVIVVALIIVDASFAKRGDNRKCIGDCVKNTAGCSSEDCTTCRKVEECKRGQECTKCDDKCSCVNTCKKSCLPKLCMKECVKNITGCSSEDCKTCRKEECKRGDECIECDDKCSCVESCRESCPSKSKCMKECTDKDEKCGKKECRDCFREKCKGKKAASKCSECKDECGCLEGRKNECSAPLPTKGRYGK